MAKKIIIRENQYNRLFTLKENQEDEIKIICKKSKARAMFYANHPQAKDLWACKKR